MCQAYVYRWQGSQAQESQTECKMESQKCPSNMLHNTKQEKEHKQNMGTKTCRAPIQH
jgi:hypothetical protein